MKTKKREYFKMKSPIIKGKEGELVRYPISHKYDGGIVVARNWYEGVEVGKPIVPEGFKLVSIGCGLQLNCFPPEATARLVRECPKISLPDNPFSQVQQL